MNHIVVVFLSIFSGGFRIEKMTILVDSEERNVFPGGVADRADEASVLPDMRGDAREMEGVATLRRVNGRPLPCLDAAQAYPTATLQKKKSSTKPKFQLSITTTL